MYFGLPAADGCALECPKVPASQILRRDSACLLYVS